VIKVGSSFDVVIVRTVLVTVAAALLAVPAAESATHDRIVTARVETHLVPGAYSRPHLLLMTLGGPIYCGQIKKLAAQLNASRLCTDYSANQQRSGATRAGRMQDWGDPRYLGYVARLPAQLRKEGVKISKLVLIGVSYSGYAVAQLVATHPELRPDALIVLDSYLDLTARFHATREGRPTRREIKRALKGTPAQRPNAYLERSPSGHLEGLARAVESGTKLVVSWSVAPDEKEEFFGATCAREANAQWLAQLATILGEPVVGYVSRLRHAQLLHRWGTELAAVAGLVEAPATPLPVDEVSFEPYLRPPVRSYCAS
jgi:pimeloyl-ACP methyl ester carboxylesterase